MKKEEVLVVGNNLEVDIVPALNEGYNAVLIGGPIKKSNIKVIPNIYSLLEILPNV